MPRLRVLGRDGALVWKTEARRLLRAHLATVTQAELARRVGCSQPEIARWAAGTARPSTPEALLALQVRASIPIEAWVQEPIVIHSCIVESATQKAEAPQHAAR